MNNNLQSLFNEKTKKSCSTWPFQEARKIANRVKNYPLDKPIIFETGYGPSGLPHIGTFCEVYRTTLVRQAFTILTNRPTRLICFSDDMDGLRKVPENIPNKKAILNYIGQPLTKVPDPFDLYSSFGEHNNARLQKFLDNFNFDYEFYSATDCYKSGLFDKNLLKVLKNYDEIKSIVLPTLGEERKKTYSPFLPICKRTGKVLEVSIVEKDYNSGTVSYFDPETDKKEKVSVTGGSCKLQWKCDWAMRWSALEVDYEMAGKDLIDSVSLSGKIIRKIGALPPEGFNYELFLDENGEKISKSRGNGLTIEEWLKYGPKESLSYFMYGHPKRAKRLFFDVIPKSVDEYISHLNNFKTQIDEEKVSNPVLYVHDTNQDSVPDYKTPLSFSLLLNLASVCHAEEPEVIWSYIKKYSPETKFDDNSLFSKLVNFAIIYYNDRVKPKKKYRSPNDLERKALNDLIDRLNLLNTNPEGEEIQKEIYAVGKENEFDNLRDWFRALYEILLGQPDGPRMGSFVSLYGVSETIALIKQALEGKLK